MRYLRIHWVLIGVLFLGFAAYKAEAKQMAVIVNKGNGTQELSSEEIAKILKCNTRKWTTGAPITIVVREPASPEMELLLARIYKVSPEEMKNFIAQHKDAIMVVNSNQAMLAAVQSMPGAVGFIDVFLINQGVAVVKIDGKLPVEFGYIFRGN